MSDIDKYAHEAAEEARAALLEYARGRSGHVLGALGKAAKEGLEGAMARELILDGLSPAKRAMILLDSSMAASKRAMAIREAEDAVTEFLRGAAEIAGRLGIGFAQGFLARAVGNLK